ncbi:MAG: hypothetical protein IJB00_05335 [Akkermansia sp.]|nr:hypothetical protein [Akkermansia sp.]
MSVNISKIGIIQSQALPGDFSRNLRRIVQGYRECLDRGAQIAITSIYALSGLNPQDLMRRHSFTTQMEAAAEALAAELAVTDVPLITGFCINPLRTPVGDEFDDEWEADDGLLYDSEEEDYGMHESVIMVPCVIHRGVIRLLTDGGTATIADRLCHITTAGEESMPEGEVDLIVHLPKSPWNNRSTDKETQIYSWESHAAQAPVVCVHPVGTEGGDIYGGGSSLYVNNKLVDYLPFFEPACRTLRTGLARSAPTKNYPGLLLQVEKALTTGIHDTVRQQGYSGVCVPLDSPNGKLLTNLCIRALGADNVFAISFSGNKYPGIECIQLQVEELLRPAREKLNPEYAPGLEQRIKGCMLASSAEEKGMLLLSALDRPTLMLGDFTLYGETCGYLAPLGSLYKVDLFLLCRHIAETEPDMAHAIEPPAQPEQDRIIHDLTERNIAASDILRHAQDGMEENPVRSIQRKIMASALKRTQLPLILNLAGKEEQLSIPLSSRLND